MNEERKVEQKQVKTTIINDESLQTFYVNSVNMRAGLDDFFLTFGTALPLEIHDSTDLEKIDTISAQSLFRCAVSRSTMKQMIDSMTSLYENQTRQIELLQTLQRKEEDNDYNSSDSSEA